MKEDNVVPIPSIMERLTIKLRSLLKANATNRTDWINIQVSECTTVADMRAQFPSNIEFGHWWDASEFANIIDEHTRAAMIAMGREPDVLRKCLEATERHSLRYIHAEEFARFGYVDKTPETDPAPEHPTGSQTGAKGSGARGTAKSGRKASASAGGAPKAKPSPKADQAYTAYADARKRGDPVTNLQAFAKQIGLGHASVKKAADRWRHEQSIKETKEQNEDEALNATVSAFTDKQKLKFEEAMAVYKKKWTNRFHELVNEEALKIAEKLKESLSRHNEKLEMELVKLREYVNTVRKQKGVFTEQQFNNLLKCVHPDTVNSISPEIRNEVFSLVRENQMRLVKP